MSYKPVTRVGFRSSYDPSPEQQAIFDCITNSNKNINVSAAAGSGKTTTSVWAMSLNNKRSAMAAFNKDIVTEIEPRCPDYVTVKTFHGYGYGVTAKSRGKLFVNGRKVQDILKAYSFLNPDGHKDNEKGKVLSRLFDTVSLIDKLRVTLTDETNPTAVMDLADEYAIDIDKLDDVIGILPDVFAKIIDSKNVTDFTDMMWLPIRLGLEIPQFPMIYVDECQDLNNLMIAYVEKMVSERVMLVGDPFQAIYGFAGANSKSFELLSKKFGSVNLPLNTCYRCGKNIIELAQTIVPSIMPYDKNPDGDVRKMEEIDFNMEEGSMIISRRNASLIKPYFRLIKDGKKAYIKGKDIGESIIRLISKMKATTMSELLDSLEEHTEKTIEKQNYRKKPNESSIQLVQDQHDCIMTIAEDCFTVEEMKEKVKNIFSDSGKGVILSSAHKSKGLEANHVTIVDYSRIRLANDKMTPEQHEQERNLHYVSLTRAKTKLDLVG